MLISTFSNPGYRTESRDNSVSTTTRPRARRLGIRFSAEAENYFLRRRVQTGSGAHPASSAMGTGYSFPGVKRLGRESDHSPPSSA
jgi:hypothetical protein